LAETENRKKRISDLVSRAFTGGGGRRPIGAHPWNFKRKHSKNNLISENKKYNFLNKR
jgi:hypothetical protein